MDISVSSKETAIPSSKRTPYRLLTKQLSCDVLNNVSHAPPLTQRRASLQPQTSSWASQSPTMLRPCRASFESEGAPAENSNLRTLYVRDSDILSRSTSRRTSLVPHWQVPASSTEAVSLNTPRLGSMEVSFSKSVSAPRPGSHVRDNVRSEPDADAAYQKLQFKYIRSQLRVSQKIIADPEVVPEPKPVLLLLDGKFADLARRSSVADALTVRALMIKGVSRAHITKSGLSLNANKINWDLLEADRDATVPSATTYLENKCQTLPFEQDLIQQRITMRRRSQVALIVRLRSLTSLDPSGSPTATEPV